MNVERWDTHEQALTATGAYTNPFLGVDLTVRWVHTASGKSIEVNGFYDGGATWRFRFMPTELGVWRYTTRSNDAGLDGKTGEITCVKPTKPYLHGPIQTVGYHFRHADATWRFLTSTRLSCQFAGEDVNRRVASFLRKSGINRVFFMMGGVAGTLKDLWAPGPDFNRFSVTKFQAIDSFIDILRQVDIMASPYFYYFNDGVMRNLTPEQDKAYIRYGMARFGAYCNIMPCLSNEVEQKYSIRHVPGATTYDLRSHEWANWIGPYLASQSVFGAPVTVHNPMEHFEASNPGFYGLLLDWPFPWANYMMRQAQVGSLGAAKELSHRFAEDKVAYYCERGYARHNQLLIDLRRYGIPVINEEPGYEMGGGSSDGGERMGAASWNTQTAWRLLPTFWTAATAGAYTMWGNPATYEMGDPMWGLLDSVVPQRFKLLHDVMTRFPYWEMEPHNELVSADEVTIEGAGWRTNFCLAKPGERYIVYSLRGFPLKVNLKPNVRYRLTQLDPRTGEETDLGLRDGGEQGVSLAGRDRVLIVEAV